MLTCFLVHATPLHPASAQSERGGGIEATPEARTEAALRAWLEEQLASASVLPVVSGLEIAWKVERHFFLSASEAERLRGVVANRPDHPKRLMLEVFDRVQEQGPSSSFSRAIFLSGDAWRLCSEPANSSGDAEWSYHDIIVTPDLAWQMNRSQLTLVDPRGGYPKGYNLGSLDSEFRNAFDALVFGGLGQPAAASASVESVSIEGNRWSARLRADNCVRWTHRGRWSANDGAPIVTMRERLGPNRNPDQSTAMYFFDWRRDETLGRNVCARSELRHADGTLARRLFFDRADLHDPEEIAPMFDPPPIDGVDPIRGSVEFTSIRDYTGAERTATTVVNGSERQQIIGAAPSDAEGSRTARWALAGGLVAALFAVRVMRNRWAA